MSKKSPAMPAAPDPVKTIQAQTDANHSAAVDSAKLNAVDIYGPSGSVTYKRNPDGTPSAQVTTLNPTEKATYDAQTRIAQNLTGMAGKRVNGIPTSNYKMSGQYDPRTADLSGFKSFGDFQGPYDPKGYGDVGNYIDQAGQAAFDHEWNYAKDAFAQDTDRMTQNLADRGLPVGGEAWTNATRELTNNHNRQIESMANNARSIASQEAQNKMGMEQSLQSQAFDQAMKGHQQNQSDAAQQLQTEQGLRSTINNEDLTQRTQNFNEASAFLTGAPALQMPNAPNMPNYSVQAPDVGGITNSAYNAQMQQYNARQAQNASKWQGAANLGGAAAMMAFRSSKALKHDDGAPVRIIHRERALDKHMRRAGRRVAQQDRILSLVRRLRIRTWRYRPEIDPSQTLHIGPYAEDWKDLLGVGNGKEISYVDVSGIALHCIQRLADENDDLRQRIEKLERK